MLRIIHNTQANPTQLEEDFKEEFNFIKITFFLLDNTSTLQAMDQYVIANFKMLYTKALFQNVSIVQT